MVICIHLYTYQFLIKKSITKALTKGGFSENEITVISGSEYYHQWRVERPKTKGVFNKVLKFMKKVGDFLGRGEMLVAIVKKQNN